MAPQLRNPFKPSKLDRIAMLVSKVTALLNLSLTIKQVNQLHALILVNGLNHLEPIIITQIINTRSNHSAASIRYLRSLLQYSKYPNFVTRTSVVQFLYQRGEFQEALREYARLHRSGMLPCSSTVVSAIKVCTRMGNRIGGIVIHGHVHGYGLCGDVHVGTALVGFYSKISDAETRKKVFDEMSERNVASRVIDEYLESGNLFMAEQLFSVMGDKDVACWNSVVSWYTRTGDMEKALATFGPMLVKTSASWTAMITGYVDSGDMEIARNFYDVMPEQDVISCMKMIDGYSKNGAVESAREIFNEINEKDHLLYDAMITCYKQNDRLKDALQLFDEMIQPNVNVQPNSKTLATIISICSQWGNLSFGIWIHETLIKQIGVAMDDHLGTQLIELYANCGRLDKAYGLFCGLRKKELGVYTTMILACSRNGWKHDAIKFFEEMLEANICPNLVTFSGLLTALNHVGWTKASYHGFNSTTSVPYPRPFKS